MNAHITTVAQAFEALGAAAAALRDGDAEHLEDDCTTWVRKAGRSAEALVIHAASRGTARETRVTVYIEAEGAGDTRSIWVERFSARFQGRERTWARHEHTDELARTLRASATALTLLGGTIPEGE